MQVSMCHHNIMVFQSTDRIEGPVSSPTINLVFKGSNHPFVECVLGQVWPVVAREVSEELQLAGRTIKRSNKPCTGVPKLGKDTSELPDDLIFLYLAEA